MPCLNEQILTTLVDNKPSSSLITALHPDEWMCIHSPPNAKSVNDAHTAPVYAQSFRLTEKNNEKVVLLVNTRNSTASVTVAGAAGGSFTTEHTLSHTHTHTHTHAIAFSVSRHSPDSHTIKRLRRLPPVLQSVDKVV